MYNHQTSNTLFQDDGTTERHPSQVLPYTLRAPPKYEPQESLTTFNCSRGHHPTCLSSPPGIITLPRMGCGTVGFRADLVIFIPSVAQHTEERWIIRRSWAWMAQQSNSTFYVQHVFVYGRVNSGNQEILDRENRIFGDVLQGDFDDTYRNLTLKTIMAYRWFSDNCPHAKFLMKADDDMFINTMPLLRHLQRTVHDQHVMIGSCYVKRRNKMFPPRYKWFMSKQIYPDKLIPAYCCGCGYIITAHTARDIAKVMQWLPVLPIEDLFTGLAITRLGYKVKILNSYGFARPFDKFRFLTQCKKLQRGEILSIHMVPKLFLLRLMKSCPINGSRMHDSRFLTHQVNA